MSLKKPSSSSSSSQDLFSPASPQECRPFLSYPYYYIRRAHYLQRDLIHVLYYYYYYYASSDQYTAIRISVYYYTVIYIVYSVYVPQRGKNDSGDGYNNNNNNIVVKMNADRHLPLASEVAVGRGRSGKRVAARYYDVSPAAIVIRVINSKRSRNTST